MSAPPGVMVSVPASEVQVGDLVIVPGYVGKVTAIDLQDLAPHTGPDGKPAQALWTSNPSHRWSILRIMLEGFGIGRFAHEQMTVVKGAGDVH